MQTLQQRAENGDAVAQFHMGILLASQSRYTEAREQLRKAATRVADAAAWLGLFSLFGYLGAPELELALQQLLMAEAAGSGEASYWLATLSWTGVMLPREPQRMAERLVSAARRDHLGALRALAMLYARGGEHDPAMRRLADQCLARGGALHDRTCLYLLGLRWRRHGDESQRAQAEGFLAAAAQRRLERAARDLRLGVPAALPRQPALFDLPLPPIDTRADGTPVVHHTAPLIETVDGYFSADECEYLIAVAEPNLARSQTVAATDGRMMIHDARTSSDTTLFSARDDFVARWLQARMLDRLGAPMSHGEHIVVLRYRPGEQYKAHYDYLPPDARGNRDAPDQPGQRVHTVFCYLSDVDEGGETDFPRLQQRISPRQGRIVHFENLDARDQPEPLTLHAGLTPARGEKWLGTIWTRQRPYRAW